MNEDDLRAYLQSEFPDAERDLIDEYIEWAAGVEQTPGSARTGFRAFRSEKEAGRAPSVADVLIDQPFGGSTVSGKGFDYDTTQTKGALDDFSQTPDGVFVPAVIPSTGEVLDTRFIRVPELGLIRMEEYLSMFFRNDPRIQAHQQQLARDAEMAAASSASMGISDAQQDMLRFQIAQEQYFNMPLQPTQEQMMAGVNAVTAQTNLPDHLATNDPRSEQMQQAVEMAHENRMRFTYAWGAMSPGRLETWLSTADADVVNNFQMLASVMGLPEDQGALLNEIDRGFGPATASALREFGRQMFMRRDTHTLNEFIGEQIDATFNSMADTVVSARAARNLDDALGADDDQLPSVITLNVTKPEDMEDQLRDIVGELFGERQALSGGEVDSIVAGGLAREREAALAGSAEYQRALMEAERASKEQPTFEDATIAAFLDATSTGFGSGAQQYMGMTPGMYEHLAGRIGVTDISQITPDEEDLIAKLWAETMISQAGGNMPQAFANANASQLQGRTMDATQPYNPQSGGGDPSGQGIRGSVPGLYNQGVLGSAQDLVPEQMGRFNDSIEAMTGLSYVDLVAGNYNNGSNDPPPPIVIDAPRFDMVRYLRRAAINTNPQKFAKADMRRRMQTWINDLILAESPARMG